jgi:transposase InsO family protein
MNSHKHARLTAKGRALLVSRVQQEGWTLRAAAEAAGISVRTVSKWLARYRAQGPAGLVDRSSRPRRSPRALSGQEIERLRDLRLQRWPQWRIAQEARRGVATISRCMSRLGLSRLDRLEPAAPAVRYERAAAGELLHLDTKKLGRIEGLGHRITGQRGLNRNRGIGWDMVHLAIDDHSRVSYALIKTDECGPSCAQFLRQAVAYYASLGVPIARVMTDNGTGYRSKAFRAACGELGVRHIRTRPYTPKTNGKAERFVQTSLREWAYVRPYLSSAQREAALQPFLHRYNWHRPHSALNRRPPISRIPAMSNLLELNT